jgi:hypothetical protein
VREQFRNMQDPGNDQNPGNNNNAGGPFQHSYNNATQADEQPKKKEPRSSSSPNTMGEYIDFEEVK